MRHSRDTEAVGTSRRGRLRALASGAAIVLLLLSYNTVAGHWVTGRNRHAPRDPETGILRGAEPRTLGPDDAPVAVLLVHGYLGGSNNFADLPDRLAA